MVIKTRFLRFSKAVFRSLFYLGLLFPAFLFFSSVTIFFTLQCFTLPFLYSPCIKQENHQCLKLFLIALIMFSATMRSVQNMLHNSYGCSLRILFFIFFIMLSYIPFFSEYHGACFLGTDILFMSSILSLVLGALSNRSFNPHFSPCHGPNRDFLFWLFYAFFL